jgi:hypothetical protein
MSFALFIRFALKSVNLIQYTNAISVATSLLGEFTLLCVIKFTLNSLEVVAAALSIPTLYQILCQRYVTVHTSRFALLRVHA